MRDGVVATRPIKGTRKRGATREEDAAMRKELEESDKDKSELLMIVDLERNDVNRVCMPGSVKVTEMYSIETYATVFHLVSEVQGRLAEDKNVVDLLEEPFRADPSPGHRNCVRWRSLKNWSTADAIFIPARSVI